jgi:hypothetical protein
MTKHSELRAVGHNLAASFAGGIGILVGAYNFDVFGEAARSREGYIEVNFLSGTATGGRPSRRLARVIAAYHEAVPTLCAKHGISPSDFTELAARYTPDPRGNQFTVIVADKAGRQTRSEYGAPDGHRKRIIDTEGRIRRSPIRKVG